MPMPSKPNLPPLLVRADANEAIGTGHVMRCLALAQGWRARGGVVTLLSVSLKPALRERVEDAGVILREIPRPHPESDDLRTILRALHDASADTTQIPWVVLDGYHFDPLYQSLARSSGCRLLVIDDTGHLPRYDADVILNNALHSERLRYHTGRGALTLLGTRYTLLRSEFQRSRGSRRSIPERAKKILVSLGGSDPHNFTQTVIRALQQLNLPDLEARVIVGPANSHVDNSNS